MMTSEDRPNIAKPHAPSPFLNKIDVVFHGDLGSLTQQLRLRLLVFEIHIMFSSQLFDPILSYIGHQWHVELTNVVKRVHIFLCTFGQF